MEEIEEFFSEQPKFPIFIEWRFIKRMTSFYNYYCGTIYDMNNNRIGEVHRNRFGETWYFFNEEES